MTPRFLFQKIRQMLIPSTKKHWIDFPDYVFYVCVFFLTSPLFFLNPAFTLYLYSKKKKKKASKAILPCLKDYIQHLNLSSFLNLFILPCFSVSYFVEMPCQIFWLHFWSNPRQNVVFGNTKVLCFAVLFCWVWSPKLACQKGNLGPSLLFFLGTLLKSLC